MIFMVKKRSIQRIRMAFDDIGYGVVNLYNVLAVIAISIPAIECFISDFGPVLAV